MECKNPTEVQYIGDLPVDGTGVLPNYFLGEKDVTDATTGNVARSIVRFPSGALFPQDNMDNITALEPNNVAITIPDNQVRGVFIQNSGSAYVMQYADTTHAPMTIAVGELNDLVLTQNCGVINIPNSHSYVVGQQYYVGANGEPTTTASNYKLFIPISATKLLVNM